MRWAALSMLQRKPGSIALWTIYPVCAINLPASAVSRATAVVNRAVNRTASKAVSSQGQAADRGNKPVLDNKQVNRATGSLVR